MKFPLLISLSLTLCSSSLFGIERPKSLDSDKPEDAVERAENEIKERDAKGAPEVPPREEQGKAAWLGVLTKPVSETLRIHLDVEQGVVLDYVAPESPASKAGLRQHDILLSVEGKAVSSQQDLREAIQGHSPGDKLSLQVIAQGGKGEREVELAERPKDDLEIPRGNPQGNLPPGFPFGDLPELPGGIEDLIPGGGIDFQRELEGHMKRFEKQLQEMERGRGGLKLDFDLFNDFQGGNDEGGALNFNFKSSSSVKFVDEHGSVVLKTTDGGKEVTVRDAEGEIVFEGPWDNDQDKAAAPEDIRERLDGMFRQNRFEFRLDQIPEPDLEIPEKEKPGLE